MELLPTVMTQIVYSKTCVKQPLKNRPQIGFQCQLSLNASKKYCRMIQGEHSAIPLTFTLEHSAILLTFIKLPFVIKIFVLSIFEWPFYAGFTGHVHVLYCKPLRPTILFFIFQNDKTYG